ncbi:MAG TPA: sulfotransferase family protein [Phycisphaerae bacterium]|nr:sulfotransferase family protein [Phycisphaerae bacterium]HRW53652.1 sulfotransferase family protein [Phycisphaerae bacterium]
MKRDEFITVVSGLPRSGTSMMMSMLDAGGVPPISDGIRTADDDNPKGYYEFERVKKIREDTAWIPEARGKAVKMISKLVVDLPAGHHYRVLFMRRRMEEILASQKRMMERRGTVRDDGPSDEVMAQFFEKHVADTLGRLQAGSQFEYIEVDYNAIMTGGADAAIEQIDTFLGGGLNRAAMRKVVDDNLYRQRA